MTEAAPSVHSSSVTEYRGDRQHRQLLPLIPYAPACTCFQPRRASLHQKMDRRIGILGAEGHTDLFHISPSAPVIQQVQELYRQGRPLRRLIGRFLVSLDHYLIPE